MLQVAYKDFREASQEAAEKNLLVLWQFRFVPADFAGYGRVWAIVDDPTVIEDMRRRLTSEGFINIDDQRVPVNYTPERPLLVIHTVS